MRSCRIEQTFGSVRDGVRVEREERVSVLLAAGLFTLSSLSEGDAVRVQFSNNFCCNRESAILQPLSRFLAADLVAT